MAITNVQGGLGVPCRCVCGGGGGRVLGPGVHAGADGVV